MRRAFLLICAWVILLSGCNSQEDSTQIAMSLREKLNQGKYCEFRCEVTSDFGTSIYSFVLDCAIDSSGKLVFSIAEPASIAGIGGYIAADSGRLTFDEHVLAFPLLAQGEVSPVCAPWLFYKALSGGYIRCCGEDDRGVRVTIDDSFAQENIQVDIWLDKQQMPKYAEIFWQGRKTLTLEIESFRIQ